MPWDMGLLAGVLLLLMYYSLLVRLRPLPWILARIKSGRAKKQGDQDELAKIWRASGFFLRKFFRTDKPCLRRSLVLYHWCCQRGIEARVIVAVKKEDGELKGHSWLEVGGFPYREDVDELRQYVSVMEG